MKPKKRKLKIVVLGPVPPPLGGVSIHLLRERELLEAAGLSCSISPLGGWFENRISFSNLANAMYRTLAAVFNSLPHLSSCLHLHYSRWFYSLPVLIIAKLGKTPLVVTFHSTTIERDIASLPVFTASLLVRLLASAGLIIPVSERVKNVLVELGIKSKLRTVVLPAFLTPSEKELSPNSLSPSGLILFNKIAARKSKIIVASAYNLGLGYGFDDVYGLELLTRTIANMQIEEGITLVVSVSKKPKGLEQTRAEGKLLELVASTTTDIVLVYGEPMLPFLSIAHCYIRPSKIDGDSVALREAISLGIPCGASNVVQRPEEAVMFELTMDSLGTAIVQLLNSSGAEKKSYLSSDHTLVSEIEMLVNQQSI